MRTYAEELKKLQVLKFKTILNKDRDEARELVDREQEVIKQYDRTLEFLTEVVHLNRYEKIKLDMITKKWTRAEEFKKLMDTKFQR